MIASKFYIISVLYGMIMGIVEGMQSKITIYCGNDAI